MTVKRQESVNSSFPSGAGQESGSKPQVSIVVINFNYDRFLARAIDSALGQTYPAVEVIVVDDCSSDGSREVAEAYGDRIVTVFRPVNGGMSASANSGFARSGGDIVMFVDADDYLYPDAAERVVAAWSPGVAQVQARLDLVDVDETVIDLYPPREMAFDSGDVSALLAARGRYSTTVTTGLAFARAALLEVMPIPEVAFNRSADGYLATVVPLYGQVAAIETPVGGYRRHDSNHSGFSANIANRARWRVDHDEHRYQALRVHGPGRGVVIAAQPGLADATHLEQRLVSLCLEPGRHLYPGDRRSDLGWANAKAAWAGRGSTGRRAAHAAIGLAAGFAPLPIARAALSWKLEQSSRPKFVDALARRIRRLLG